MAHHRTEGLARGDGQRSAVVGFARRGCDAGRQDADGVFCRMLSYPGLLTADALRSEQLGAVLIGAYRSTYGASVMPSSYPTVPLCLFVTVPPRLRGGAMTFVANLTAAISCLLRSLSYASVDHLSMANW